MSRIAPASTVFDLETRLVIIGAGAAGLVAALVAAEAGLEPLVLERDALPSGSTALSAGLIPAAGTRWQRYAGIVDSAELFAQDIQAKAKGKAEPVLAEAVAHAIGPRLEWLAEKHGLAFTVIENFRYPGHSAARMHGLASRSGRELIDHLRQAAEDANIAIATEARAETLHVDSSGRPVGVTITRPDGSRESIGAEAILLACNGYGGNPALVAKHIPSLAGALYFGHPGNQGDALLWGEALGAATRDLSGHQGHGSVAHPHGILITWATITEGGVQVNREGRRFSNEAEGYSEQAARVVGQPGGVAYSIFDSRIADIARQFEDFRLAEAQGALVMAESVAELAGKLGFEAATLEATMAEVDALKIAGKRDAFGRDFAGVPRLSAPFCAVRVEGALFHTQGGLQVNAQAQVLRADGTVIPGLYAAGGAACGVSGPEASGYLSGNGLLTAVALGGIAGEAIAKALPR
jgi:fumarate reductase flavoprotein subunit